jgi:5-methyltetrahydrofolate--homocysteine methyltransferase
MGTQLMSLGLAPGECGELWNLNHPDRITEIHRRYLDAGVDLITTNSFGASSATLARHNHADKVHAINEAAARLARAAADDHAFVLADLGPFGDFLYPLGETTPEQLTEIFMQQLSALHAGGADAVIIETMTDPAELALAIHAAKKISNWPVIATYAFDRGDGSGPRTMMGASVPDAVKAAIDAGADIVGANCGTSLSLDDYLALAQALVACAGQTPVILQPNAGQPRLIDGELTYTATPEQMAQLARNLLTAGVKIVGGCCGTTPQHLQAIANEIKK